MFVNIYQSGLIIALKVKQVYEGSYAFVLKLT